MDEAEFRAQVEQLPPGMRFVVGHVVTLSVGVMVLFGALLIVALLVHTKESGVIVVFCIVAILMATANLGIFRYARRRVDRGARDPES